MKHLICVMGLTLVACNSGYKSFPVPRPTAYYRIPAPGNEYKSCAIGTINFDVNANACAQINENKLTLSYPSPWNANVYCTFTAVDSLSLPQVINNRAERMALDLGNYGLHRQTFTSSSGKECSVIYTTASTPTPLSFLALDSTLVISGTMELMDGIKTDSVRPVVNYIKNDIINALKKL